MSCASCPHHLCQRQPSQVHLAIHERQRAPGCLKRLGEPLQMTILRWKAQSLQFHRHLTGPESVASRQGILPLFAKLAFVIASCGGAVASMAKKRWLSGNSDMMTIASLPEIGRAPCGERGGQY